MKYCKIVFAFFLFLLHSVLVFAQKPKDGTYIYTIAFAEWNGKSNGADCIVKIKGDSIWIFRKGENITGKKGDMLDEGIIVKHKSGQWIIAHKKKDRNAKQIGGCSDGPRVIDFKKKKFWMC